MAELNTLSGLLADATLKAYYRFESGALTTDSSGEANTLTNTGTVAEDTGKYGGAADFGDANSTKYFLANTDLGIGGGSITLAGWHKPNGDIASGTWAFQMQEDAASHVRFDIRYEYNGGTRRVLFNRTKMNVGAQSVTHNITLGSTSWTHLALTYDATSIIGYVNGLPVGTTAASGDGAAVGVDSIKMGVGDDGSSLEAYSSSDIDDITYFSRALTAAEILQLYSDPASSGLQAKIW